MRFECDVCVVGGGPAGSAAAIWSARQGLETILLESSSFPRDRPGETLHPGMEPLFRQLGLETEIHDADFPRHRGHWISWGGPRRFDAFGGDARGPWLGFHAWRAELDSIMLAGAKAAGVKIIQPCRAVAPIVEGGRLTGVKSASGDVRATFTIDASGRTRWLHRTAAIPYLTASRRLIAVYGYSNSRGVDLPNDPMLEGDASGWTWVARVRPDLYAWTRLDFGQLRKMPPAALRNACTAAPARGADVTWRILRACSGPGYFAVGDAASVMDPAASHGVLKAVMSGILAADLIARSLRGNMTEDVAISAYHDWTEQWFERDCRELLKLYALSGAVPISMTASAARISLCS